MRTKKKARSKAKKAANGKAAGKRTSKKVLRPAANDRAVRVRMYDVGFGDCFMLWIPAADRDRKVLVDCGSIAKRVKSIAEIVEKVIEDATEEDGVARIDVVIATHRHRDHVSGFARAAWDNVEVKEVWMPWTENPDDPVARRIRDTQNRLAISLNAAFGALRVSRELADLALNALTNDSAMETLHSGFKSDPERFFLPEPANGDDAAAKRTRHFETTALPNTTVFVLGPSRDDAIIKDMNPPAGESYLNLVGSTDGLRTAPKAFGSDWAVEHPGFPLSAADEQYIHDIGTDMEEGLAVSLDSAVNGTSLMLVFKIGRIHLLFPGDAQWGTWRAALDDPDWNRLLSKTRFYKVGHHGSHNATPIEFVEKTLDGIDKLAAMVSVRPRSNWPHIPRKPLLGALKKRKAKVSRSDQKKQTAPFTRSGDYWVEATIELD
jgi:beta-lactamase superfamily II metal-dependent hydrolase